MSTDVTTPDRSTGGSGQGEYVDDSLGRRLYTGEKSIDFVHNWKRSLGVGLILVTISLILLGIFRLNPGIEFRGGSEFRISDVGTVSTQPAIDAVEKLGATDQAPLATIVGGDSVRIQTSKLTDAQTSTLRDDLAAAYDVDPGNVTSSFIGPSWGQDVSRKALIGLGVFLALVTLLISVYFRTWAMAAGAIIALLHDLLITTGVYAATGFEVTPATVIGFLTILGYSLYDTVVVFDKVRENTAGFDEDTSSTYAERVNLAVNQTLIRSINTSIVALLPVAAILFIGAFLLGASTLRDIALALFVGMLVGTYSSIFVAPASFVLLRSRDKRIREHAKAVFAARREAEAIDGEADGAADRVAPGHQREQPKKRR